MAQLEIVAKLKNLLSPEAAKVKTDIQGITQAVGEADVKAAAFAQRQRLLASEMNKLTKEVALGKMSVADATKEYEKFEKGLVKIETVAPQVAQSLNKIDDGADKSGFSFTELNQALELVAKGFNLVVGASRQLYEIIGEGAKIDAAANTFKHLADSIDTTADSLMGTLHTATSGMVSDADSMVAANRFVAMGLANTQEEAGTLASIATQLGVAFRGDAVSGMEELALMLANQSIPRLDSFGVSAGKVRERINELMSANQGMTRETAFMQAFMEQAQVTIGKIGPQSETAAAGLARIEAASRNMGDEIKSTVAEEFAPLMDRLSTEVLPKLAAVTSDSVVPAIREMVGLFGDIVNDGGSAEDQIDSLGDAFDALTETIQVIRDVRNNIADTSRVMRIMMQDGAQIKELLGIGFTLAGNTVEYFSNILQGDGRGALAAYNQQAREFYELFGGLPIIGSLLTKSIEATNAAMDKGAAGTSRFTKEVKDETDALKLEQDAVKQSAEMHQLRNHWTLEDAQGTKVAADAAYLASDAYAEWQDKLTQGNAQLSENEAMIAAANAATAAKAEQDRAAADAVERNRQAVEAYNRTLGDYFAEAASGGNELELFTHNLDELGEQTYTVTNLTADQQVELDRLQGAYDKAAQTIRDYELGIKGATMTDEERNKKIEEQRLIMETLQGSMQPLIEAGTAISSTNNALTISTTAVNQSLFEMISAGDGSAASIAAAGLALGIFDEVAAEAFLKTAVLKIKLEELAQAYAAGDIGLQAMMDGMQTAVQEVNEMSLSVNSATGSVNLYDESANRATQSTDSMISKFGEVPDEVETELVVDTGNAIGATQAFLDKLNSVPRSVDVQVNVHGGDSSGTNYGAGGYQGMSSGGRMTPMETYLVGDAPGGGITPYSELFIPDRPGFLLNNETLRRMMGSSGGGGDAAAPFVPSTPTFGGGGNNTPPIQIINQFNVPVTQDMVGQIAAAQEQAVKQALSARDRRVSAINRMG